MTKAFSLIGSILSVAYLTSCIHTETIRENYDYDFAYKGIAYNIINSSEFQVELVPMQKPSNYQGNISIPSYIKYEDDNYRVTQIGKRSFFESHITEITIPYTIIEIKTQAFEDSDLKILTIEDSDETLVINDGLDYCPIETAYIGRTIEGNWINSSLNKLELGEKVRFFSVNLTQPLEIICNSVTPPKANINATETVFQESIVYVPSNAIAKYEESEDWNKFKIILVSD